jgi:hypothetical protein
VNRGGAAAGAAGAACEAACAAGEAACAAAVDPSAPPVRQTTKATASAKIPRPAIRGNPLMGNLESSPPSISQPERSQEYRFTVLWARKKAGRATAPLASVFKGSGAHVRRFRADEV